MATATKRIRVDITTSEEVKDKFSELAKELGKSNGELLEVLLEGYQATSKAIVSDFTADLDDTKRVRFFDHLLFHNRPKKELVASKPYLVSLAESQHTLKELVEAGLEASKKDPVKFLEAALIYQSKMEMSQRQLRDHRAKEPDKNAIKMQEAYDAIKEKFDKGDLRTVNNRIGLSRVAKAAGIGYEKALEWAISSQEDLVPENLRAKKESEAKFDVEMTL